MHEQKRLGNTKTPVSQPKSFTEAGSRRSRVECSGISWLRVASTLGWWRSGDLK